MQIKGDKKISKKTIIGVITLAFLISPLSFLFAEDYPAEYLGEGYRGPLSEIMQTGYNINVFTNKDRNLEEWKSKMNWIHNELPAYAAQAAPESANGILATASQHKYNTDNLRVEIVNLKQQREKNASAQGEFTYIPYSDGKIVYFKDGLVNRVENERAVDEFGNLSIRNSYNYQYNDKRLLISFEADTKDILGNITHIRQYGMKYTADSLFYATKDTRANKNITEYFVEEIDPAGNKKVTHFYGGSYEGKLLRAFSQTIEDEVYGKLSFKRSNITYEDGNPEHPKSYYEEGIGSDGLAYTLERTNTTYNDKDQVTGYHEEKITTQIDGSKTKTIVDAQFKYLGVAHQFGPDVEEPDPDRLLESKIIQTVENADGSIKTETTTTTYNYEGNKLIGASGHSEFNGQESKWFEYKDAQGHTLSRNEDRDGNVTYSYVDPDTLETIIVPADQVSATLKDGNKYKGYSDTDYEILYGKPMAKQVRSLTNYYNPEDNNTFKIEKSTITYNNGLVNNLPRMLGSDEHTEIWQPLLDPEKNHIDIQDIHTDYFYDQRGNPLDAQGEGIKEGWEYSSERGWCNPYKSKVKIDYVVILGKFLQKEIIEEKDYEYGN